MSSARLIQPATGAVLGAKLTSTGMALTFRLHPANKKCEPVTVSQRAELRNCVKVAVAVWLGSPCLIVFMVFVDVKQH